ncbi:hypothetical protein WK26_01280 [Burkholderia vietnamiensis]|nr:hypothetical protein WK26_01280 [Burkholderia vietnamiensis]KVS22407.1 hypothetical protein WK35_18400 [Burkholderia vietnamiensis]
MIDRTDQPPHDESNRASSVSAMALERWTERPLRDDSTGAACVSRWPRGRGTRCTAGRARASSVPMKP